MLHNNIARAIAAVLLVFLIVPVSSVLDPVIAKPRFAAIAVDAKTGRILFSRNADSQCYPASLTKVMTLYIVFQELQAGRLNLDTRLTVSRRAASMQPSKLGLKPGATIRVEDAIKALVTKSANDIAVTVAEGIGRTEHAFAQRMTRTARYLGMTRTRFRNASGLPNGQQVTTARDMATLGLRIQRDFPKFYRYFKIRKFTYKGRQYFTHNRLLGHYQGTDGIKTGYTRASGYNLTSSVRRGKRHVVAVVLGAKSGRSRNKYMMSMLTRAFKRLPKSRARTIANLAGKPPGLKPAPKQAVTAKPPLPTPKPKVEPGPGGAEAVPAADRTAPAKLVAGTKPRVLAHSVNPASARPPANSWSIQIGAYSDEDEAKRRLSDAQSMGFAQLSGKSPFTVAFYKNDKLLYRARFGGFGQSEARKTCRALKQKSINCYTLAPRG